MAYVEIWIVLAVTFGLSGLSSALSLTDSFLAGNLASQSVALNPTRSNVSAIDFLWQLLSIVRLCAWAALGLYLLWRIGFSPRRVGLIRDPRNWPRGLVLAAVIGLPGLALYLVAHALGMNLTVIASGLTDHWWRVPVLVLAAIANAVAEEVLVVAYLVTNLRRLGWSENGSLAASAVLRGSYHLYQGIGGGLGNLAMGLVFGRYWQRRNRLWPLIIAHATIDTVAYLGYAFLHGHVSWLP
ncbi:CPBP family intramembrane metalloprotease [Skermania sp. ID1734]|uniref:CPBP family intramembrane glutamic endopeptidase n=1 Tax=Skermania sp. ID1734 TaxID=2597516 RepID=UPI00117D2130|nr:CPBP family intramembrane glutamic endopeptidase [Skermania sp. ID1734]TSE00858.1 CPBP family intramembrane metalloprotease [Skermania sp. ID1734]